MRRRLFNFASAASLALFLLFVVNGVREWLFRRQVAAWRAAGQSVIVHEVGGTPTALSSGTPIVVTAVLPLTWLAHWQW